MSYSYEIIGNIAVIQVPKGASQKELAKKVMKQNKNVKTVAKRTSEVSGPYRIKKVKVIMGEQTTETIHKENNVKIKVDINEAYYSPRLQTERLRIIQQVKPEETIIDLFAGVGPYTIGIAKNTKAKKIYAIDHNPKAIEYLLENRLLNKAHNVSVLIGNSLEIIKELPNVDRIIMNAPRQNNQETLEAAKEKIKKDGIIHYYTTNKKLPKINLKDLTIINQRKVIEYAPGKKHICLDLKA